MLELLIFALLTYFILESRDEEVTGLKKEPDSIDLFLFILEVDGVRREIYTFNQDIAEILEQEQINLQKEDYFEAKIIEGVYYIKVIRSYGGSREKVKVIPFNREIRGGCAENSPFLAQGFRGKRIRRLPFSS